MSDSPLTDENLSATPSATAVAEPDEQSSGPVCEKCGNATDAAACPRCGWYPSLGMHVEIDEAFEAVTNAPVSPPEGEPAAAESAKPGLQQHLEVWRGLIPGWAWLMIGTTLGVVGAGVAVRVASLSNPVLQSYAGVTGLIGGLAVLLLAHVVGFLLNSFHDADSSVSDLVIKPLKYWKRTLAALPERLWLANSANAALTTALTSALIIGGIPYERLLDWGFKARPKASLVGMIADQASKNQGGPDNLEDAVEELAGTADGLKKDEDKKPKLVRQRLECLILGYRTDSDGQLTELLLAADQKGKLKSIGKVRPTLSGGEKIELVGRFKESTASRPFVKTSESAIWLRPRFTCRVTYNEWPDGKRPKGLKWEELLDEVKLPW